MAKQEKNLISQEEEVTIDIFRQQKDIAFQSYLNAYEVACQQYLNEKINPKNFETTYKDAVKELVQNFPEHFQIDSSNYGAIITVYEKWRKSEN
jgi:hypothetical protein